MSLSSGEASEKEAEEAEEAEPYADWPLPNRKEFGRHVQEAMEAHTTAKKGDKLTLSSLVSIMDNVPENVLEFHKLTTVLSKLKGMQKLPPQAKTQQIVEALQAIATAAGVPPADQQEEEAKMATEAPKEESPPPAETAENEEDAT